MTTLNMDLDIADQAQQRMAYVYTTMSDEAKKIRTQVYTSLQDSGNWSGFSAKEFFDSFNALDNAFYHNLEELNTMAGNLRAEIDQWKAMQDHLG
jgi:uncharacterized protein YukE